MSEQAVYEAINTVLDMVEAEAFRFRQTCDDDPDANYGTADLAADVVRMLSTTFLGVER